MLEILVLDLMVRINDSILSGGYLEDIHNKKTIKIHIIIYWKLKGPFIGPYSRQRIYLKNILSIISSIPAKENQPIAFQKWILNIQTSR